MRPLYLPLLLCSYWLWPPPRRHVTTERRLKATIGSQLPTNIFRKKPLGVTKKLPAHISSRGNVVFQPKHLHPHFLSSFLFAFWLFGYERKGRHFHICWKYDGFSSWAARREPEIPTVDVLFWFSASCFGGTQTWCGRPPPGVAVEHWKAAFFLPSYYT